MTRRKLTPEQKAAREAELKEYRKAYYREHKEKIAEQIAAIARRKEYFYTLYNEGLLRVAPSPDALQEYLITIPLSTHTLEKLYAKQE